MRANVQPINTNDTYCVLYRELHKRAPCTPPTTHVWDRKLWELQCQNNQINRQIMTKIMRHKWTCGQTNRTTDQLTNIWTDGPRDRWMTKQTDGLMNIWTNKWTGGPKDGRMDRPKYRRTNRRMEQRLNINTDGRIDKQANRCLDRLTDRRTGG